MEEEKKKCGGKREGSGRKNRNNKAFNIKIMPEEKEILVNALNEYRAIHGGTPYKPIQRKNRQ